VEQIDFLGVPDLTTDFWIEKTRRDIITILHYYDNVDMQFCVKVESRLSKGNRSSDRCSRIPPLE
jgi:hypothetical protein